MGDRLKVLISKRPRTLLKVDDDISIIPPPHIMGRQLLIGQLLGNIEGVLGLIKF